MDKNKKTWAQTPVKSKAPYNFVSFEYQPFKRYEEMTELPRHDELDDSLLSGQIDLTLTAVTPVCISNGRKGDETDFVRGTDGRYQIPGSSLRGLLRQTMQILGMGLVRSGEDFTNRRFFYRKFAAGNGTLAFPVAKQYRKLLGVETIGVVDADGRPRMKQLKNGKNVQVKYSTVETIGGYLHRENGEYYIQPVKGTVQLLPRRAYWMKAWRDTYAAAVPVWYRLNGGRFDIETNPKEGYFPGTLVSPGDISSQNHLYLFPEEDPQAERIPLSKEDRLSYKEDYEERKGTLKGTKRTMDPSYWALPEEAGEVKPVFYKRDDDRVLFGMSRFLRIPYRRKLEEGLPESHRVDQELFLDYPYAIMGFVSDSGNYRSRISVGDLPVEGDVCPEEKKMILSAPKPTFFPNYVQGGKDYNQEHFRLAGYKQYWLKEASLAQEEEADSTGGYKKGKDEEEKVKSTLRLLPAGTRFSGTIRYRNLRVDELGLLLWCLQLEPGCCHTLGQGKPYGYGRMKPEITALREYDARQLYGSLQGEGIFCLASERLQKRVEQLIECYETYVYAVRQYPDRPATPLRQLPHIRDFFYMKRHVCEKPWEVSYMKVGEHGSVTVALPTVAAYRAAWGDASQAKAPAAEHHATPDGENAGKIPVHS